MLFLSEGQAVEEWEPAKKAMFIRKSENCIESIFPSLGLQKV
jgi:hypothetical protein